MPKQKLRRIFYSGSPFIHEREYIGSNAEICFYSLGHRTDDGDQKIYFFLQRERDHVCLSWRCDKSSFLSDGSRWEFQFAYTHGRVFDGHRSDNGYLAASCLFFKHIYLFLSVVHINSSMCMRYLRMLSRGHISFNRDGRDQELRYWYFGWPWNIGFKSSQRLHNTNTASI